MRGLIRTLLLRRPRHDRAGPEKGVNVPAEDDPATRGPQWRGTDGAATDGAALDLPALAELICAGLGPSALA